MSPPDSPDWSALVRLRLLAVAAIPIWISGSVIGGVLGEVALYVGAAMVAIGLVGAAAINCPACGDRFMHMRLIHYFYGIWFFKILMAPTCGACGQGPGTTRE